MCIYSLPHNLEKALCWETRSKQFVSLITSGHPHRHPSPRLPLLFFSTDITRKSKCLITILSFIWLCDWRFRNLARLLHVPSKLILEKPLFLETKRNQERKKERNTVLVVGVWAQRAWWRSVFFLSWVSKTQPNHWTKRMANTRLATEDPRTCPGPEDRSIT